MKSATSLPTPEGPDKSGDSNMDHQDERNQATTNPSNPGGSMKLSGIGEGEYDALADLFLGESELAPEPFSNTGTDAVDTPPSSNITKGPPPAPMRFRPQSDEAMLPDQPVEVMARIGQPDRDAACAPCIEAVLLGHLPVRASLWVRQYACSTARRRDEIVALIRAAAGSTSVDLISGSKTIESSECSSLHDALQQVNTVADRVILRVDETTEPELLDRAEIDEITILTGADEAAVVASYRLIKTLTSVWDADEMTSTPHIRLAVMGATGQQVADASAKLSRAVDAFLDRPIEIIDAAGRIDATGTTNIFRDTVAHQAASILDELLDVGSGSPSLVGRIETLESTNAAEPECAVEQPAVLPAAELTAATQSKIAKDELASLIKGLTKLETRCPFALDVDLCIDAMGLLHLVTGDEHDSPMARLETVRAWVRDHLPLILRAEPELAFPSAADRSAEIGMHLITNDPHTLRSLIDSSVRMYALAEVTIGDQTARVATPIN